MSRSLRRGALAAAAIVLSIGSLAACGAGNDAQTLQVKPDNASVTKGDIEVQNALVITGAEENRKGKGPAVVSATIFNSGTEDQTLDGITLPGGEGKVALKPATGSGKISVPAGGSVVLGGEGNASAVIEGGDAAVKDGDAQAVVFQLSSTGDVGLEAFVVPATGYYAKFGPSEAPAAVTPSGTPSGSPGATPSGSPSGTPGATPAANTSGAPSGKPSGSASGSPAAGATPSGSASHAAGH
ncbi:DUF461 domain-containing protein [Streptomyces sp. NPDC089799]|uniref:DUF461 domain-containing protein n=1 Tax=Streptomyces sp. NPDC089799 TaxID=3155066 RepID=UPI0034154DC7